MAYRLISLLFLTGCSLNYIHGQCLTENDKQTAMKKETVDNLSDARFEFAIESLKKIIEIDSNENIFYSPHSLYEAITLVFFGSRRHTEVSLKKALRIPQELTKADVQRFYSYEKTYEESRKANSTNNYDFRVANRLWFSKDKKLRDCMVEFFQNELKQVDFKANPDAIRVQINDWVSDVTKGNIRDFLPVNSLDESTDTVLANAVYFKGFWQSRFQPENTKRDVFYLGQDNMTIIPFMKQKGTFNHMISEELGAHILQLPYKGDDVSMYILLPPFVSNRTPDSEPREPNVGLRQLLHRITSTEAGARELRDILDNGMPARDVELSIPRFSMEKDLPVKQLLSAMGASQVIEPDISDLSGFVADGERSPYLGDAVHRAKIELNEEGTTAAAATALFSFRSSRPTEPAHFNANHPFAYFIYDKSTKTLLFAGVFRKPTGKH